MKYITETLNIPDGDHPTYWWVDPDSASDNHGIVLYAADVDEDGERILGTDRWVIKLWPIPGFSDDENWEAIDGIIEEELGYVPDYVVG